jgi:hypothetical protein
MKRTLSRLPAALGLTTVVGLVLGIGCGSDPTAVSRVEEATRGSGGGGGVTRLAARLGGFEETPAISTAGRGTFVAKLTADGLTWAWELTYADLEGGTDGAVSAAHIHLGQRGVAGGVAIHLCGGGGGTAPCPPSPAALTGTFTAASVVGPAGQRIGPGELDELLRAARAGVTYVNVHNAAHPTGEIRGQLRAGRWHGGDGEGDGSGSGDDDDGADLR